MIYFDMSTQETSFHIDEDGGREASGSCNRDTVQRFRDRPYVTKTILCSSFVGLALESREAGKTQRVP